MKKMRPDNYPNMLRKIIAEIKSAHVIAARRVNAAALEMYWNIGKHLALEGLKKGYGGKVVEKLSFDLKNEFPNLKGFSESNLWDMKRFYEFYDKADAKLQRSVGLLPWRHNILILTKIKNLNEARFYVESAVEMGWSRDILLNFIKADYYKNSKMPKLTNFKNALPDNLQEQANEMIKDSYNLTFLNIKNPVKELELEKRLVEKIKSFMLELGKGFSFIGNQYKVAFKSKEYFIDLLFYNRLLRSLVAIDLKIGEFKPEYAGKMNFYLGLLDDNIKMKYENPSIGIILCADKNNMEVKVALRDVNKPIGVANYKLLFPQKQLKELISEEIKKQK